MAGLGRFAVWRQRRQALRPVSSRQHNRRFSNDLLVESSYAVSSFPVLYNMLSARWPCHPLDVVANNFTYSESCPEAILAIASSNVSIMGLYSFSGVPGGIPTSSPFSYGKNTPRIFIHRGLTQSKACAIHLKVH